MESTKVLTLSSLALEAEGECHPSVMGSKVEDPEFLTSQQESKSSLYKPAADQLKQQILPGY